jgi:hypothetical protein
MLFMRAKRALQKELSHNGFGKGSLLSALVVFGKVTAPSEAAAAQLTVPATALKVGAAASVVGLATTKTGILSLSAAGALTVGTVVATSLPKTPETPSSGPVATSPGAIDGSVTTLKPAAGQYIYHFPGGPHDSVWLRAQYEQNGRIVLQNWEGNYTLKNNTVTINNYRVWRDDLSVFRLPTDSADLRGFLTKMDGASALVGAVSASERDRSLLVTASVDVDGNTQTSGRPHRNAMDEPYFQRDWPVNAEIVDNRDAMHLRGWTYFRVAGQLGGRKVTGKGRLPFVFATAAAHKPWLHLRVGDDLTLVDSDGDARITNAEGDVVGRYERYSFFAGLARPWMGLHAIDIVRRDAAERRIPFETGLSPDGDDAIITITHDDTRLVYTVDLETDVIEMIDLSADGAQVGVLRFEYLQDVDGLGREFSAPRSSWTRTAKSTRDQGMLWLIRLANDQLAQ